jgi:TRAP-type C4-dicarboxylate transport system permease small subunit
METLVTGAFCVFMAWFSIRYVKTSQELGEVGVVTRIPAWISQLVIPYTFVSMSIRYAVYFILPGLKPVPPIGEGR